MSSQLCTDNFFGTPSLVADMQMSIPAAPLSHPVDGVLGSHVLGQEEVPLAVYSFTLHLIPH